MVRSAAKRVEADGDGDAARGPVPTDAVPTDAAPTDLAPIDLTPTDMTPRDGGLADTRTVARSAAWNIAGRAGPMVIAVIATPHLFADLGPTRWGLFALALSLIGIFGIFDFGIGRALTKLLAERIAVGEIAGAASLTRTGLVLLTLLGSGGALLLASVARLWVDHGLAVAPAEHDEVLHALYVLCLAVPFVILNAALWGVIAAFQRFRAANLINMPILACYYVGPLIALHYVDSLVAVMLVLVACRVVMTVCYWRLCIGVMPSLGTARADWRDARVLARLGGWMTVSNLAWPILLYVDRFLVASVLSAAAAGYYATPSDLLGRFSLVTSSVMNTAFPAMAASFRVDPARAATLVRRSIVAIASILFLPSLVFAAFSHEILTLWVGASFAAPAAPVMQWLALAVLLSATDSVVSGFLDSIGRPDINAKFSLVELALYVPALILLLRAFGIEGAAIAWTLRVGFDLAVRTALVSRIVPALRPVLVRMLFLVASATVALALPLLVAGVVERLATMGAATMLYGAALWTWGVDARERALCSGRLRLRMVS